MKHTVHCNISSLVLSGKSGEPSPRVIGEPIKEGGREGGKERGRGRGKKGGSEGKRLRMRCCQQLETMGSRMDL